MESDTESGPKLRTEIEADDSGYGETIDEPDVSAESVQGQYMAPEQPKPPTESNVDMAFEHSKTSTASVLDIDSEQSKSTSESALDKNIELPTIYAESILGMSVEQPKPPTESAMDMTVRQPKTSTDLVLDMTVERSKSITGSALNINNEHAKMSAEPVVDITFEQSNPLSLPILDKTVDQPRTSNETVFSMPIDPPKTATECGRDMTIEQSTSLTQISSLDECRVCRKHFGDSQILQVCLHVEEEASYSCKECGTKQTWSRHILKHMLILSGETSYLCGVCAVLVPLENLDSHVHTDKQFPSCAVCDQEFSTESDLEKHCHVHKEKKVKKRRHSSKNDLKDPLRVGMENDLKNPLRIRMENDLKNYFHRIQMQNLVSKTATDSPNRTKEIEARNKHFRTVGYFKCDDCDHQFKDEGELKIHRLSHPEESIILCGICGHEFKNEDQVKDHFLIHTKELSQQSDVINQKVTKAVFDNQDLILTSPTSERHDTMPEALDLSHRMNMKDFDSAIKERSHSSYDHQVIEEDAFAECLPKRTEIKMSKTETQKPAAPATQENSLVQFCLVKEGETPVGYGIVVTDPQNPVEIEDKVVGKNQLVQSVNNSTNKINDIVAAIKTSDGKFGLQDYEHKHSDENTHVSNIKLEHGACETEMLKASAESHLEEHLESKCEVCLKKFHTMEHLRKHSVHNCSFCDSFFCNVGSLGKHMLVCHNQKLRYSCEICRGKFNWLYHLQEHMLIHM